MVSPELPPYYLCWKRKQRNMRDPVKITVSNDLRHEKNNDKANNAPDWVSIGSHGCWGLPDISQDPRNPTSYIVTWQKYRDGTNEQVMDVKYSIYNSQDKSFSNEAYVFNHNNLTHLQAHPCWGYWRGEYRIFYCECQRHNPNGRAVEVKAARWPDFQKYTVSDNEKAVTLELGFHPHFQFMPVNESNAWLFYTIGNREDKISYSICDSHDGWDRSVQPIPTSKLVGEEALTMGSAFLEGNDILIYSSTYELQMKKRTEKHGVAYRFRFNGNGDAWTAEEVIVSGIHEPFTRSGELFVRVIKTKSKYLLSSQSNESHRYLAEGNDGLHFKVIRDFGERPSLGNAMVSIEGTNEILLVYAHKSGDELGGA